MGPKKWDIRDFVYGIVLPIYLWSIGYKTLNDYLDDVIKFDVMEKQIEHDQEMIKEGLKRSDRDTRRGE